MRTRRSVLITLMLHHPHLLLLLLLLLLLFTLFLLPYVAPVKAPQICASLLERAHNNTRRDAPSGNIWGKQSLMTTLLPLHNTLRRHYDAAPLGWSTPLTNQVTSYARGCTLKNIPPEIAVNYAVGYLSPGTAFEAWSAEKVLYRPALGLTKETAHFTQIVWKRTEEIGCAAHLCNGAFGKLKGWFLVCVYSPGGNVIGEAARDVGTLGGPGKSPGMEVYNPRGFLRGVMKSRGEKRRSVGKALAVVVGGMWTVVCAVSRFVFVMDDPTRRRGR